MQLLLFLILFSTNYSILKIKTNKFSTLNRKQTSSPTSLLVEKQMAKINTINNSLKYGANYIISGRYIDEQDEYNLNNSVRYSYSDGNCSFNRFKFLDYLNVIRDKHSVSHIKWRTDLENQAKIIAHHLKNINECKYDLSASRLFIGEAVYDGPQRLTEVELLQFWYKPAYYSYDFKNVTANIYFDTAAAYPMTLLLWDEVTSVGCAKVCCDTRELNICHFYPTITDPNIIEMNKHIRPNKNLNLK